MKKAIITAVVILAALTAAGILALGRLSHDTGKAANKKQPAKIPADTQQLLDSDKEKRTGQEVLNDIMNVGSGASDTGSRSDNTSSGDNPPERHEISRENYEKCGYDTGTYIVKYSDGSYEIVDGENQPTP